MCSFEVIYGIEKDVYIAELVRIMKKKSLWLVT